jgi:glutamine amidotransferase
MIIIIDYGVGNLTSIKNMIKRCGAEAEISSSPEKIAQADKFILPGVGSFDHGITNLRAAPYFSIFEKKILAEKKAVLGICLGAQLLSASSEEGNLPGLNWIPGKVIRFQKEKMQQDLKIPHMGWSDILLKKRSPLFTDLEKAARFYFVHAYHWVCSFAEDELVTASYGYEFTAGVERENIIGVQFHPEKSHSFGMKLFENFIRYY